MSLKIHCIVTGELESPLSVSLLNSGAHPSLRREDVLLYGYRYDLKRRDGAIVEGVMVPVPVWVITGAKQNIIVDTGIASAEEVIQVQAKYGVNYICSKTPEQDVVTGLAKLGLSPKDIDVVILTHLHFDHFANTELFERATFIVQRDEISMALAPPKFGIFYYREFAPHLLHVLDRVEVIEGDMKLADGIKLIKTGGHSPGNMAVLVATDVGVVALTGDLMYNYKNLELDWPSAAYWRMDEVIKGFQLIKCEADIIVPNHDWKFWDLYPTGVIG